MSNDNDDEKIRFAEMIAMLEAAYPRYHPPKETVSVFYEILKDIPQPMLAAAVLSWVSSDCAWPPTPGQLRAEAFKLQDHATGAISGGEAWREALKKVDRYNPPREEDFSDPLVFQALESIGGNRVLCETLDSALHTARARFLQAFETLRERQQRETRMLPAIRELTRQLSDSGADRLLTE